METVRAARMHAHRATRQLCAAAYHGGGATHSASGVYTHDATETAHSRSHVCVHAHLTTSSHARRTHEPSVWFLGCLYFNHPCRDGRRERQSRGGGLHGTGAPAVAPSTPADVFGTLMLPTGPLAASARSPAPAVTATGGVRGTCTGRWLQLPRAGGRPLPVPRAAARFSARARQQLTPSSGHMRMRAFRRRMTTMRTLVHIYIYTYIHNNVADRELMVTNVCDRSLYSPSHLCPV